MRVLKFGGTSVADAHSISKVIEIVKETYLEENQIVVVVSAQSGVTDSLIQLSKSILIDLKLSEQLVFQIERQHVETIKELLPIEQQAIPLDEVKILIENIFSIVKGANLVGEVTQRTEALLLSFGERLSAYVISKAMNFHIAPTNYLDAREMIKTDSNFANATVDFKTTNELIQNKLRNNNCINVVTGFIASTIDGESTTLGRGGSDYTASIIGAAIKANQIEIWTDVDGVMTADPRFVTEAKSVSNLTYNEAMELSHFGAKVIFSATMLPAMNAQIPILVKNTFNPSHSGTTIHTASTIDENPVKGISSLKNIALFNIEGSGMAGVAGISARLFNTLSLQKISVILITQASSEHSICFAISQENASQALHSINETFEMELEKGLINPIQYESNLAIVAVVGENMKMHTGLAARVFNPLARNGINLKAIAQGSSELNISIVILEAEIKKALRVLHQSLFNHDWQQLHVYIIGVGSIGKRLLEMIESHHDYLAKQKIDLQICGFMNSKQMQIEEHKIHVNSSKQIFSEQAIPSNLQVFIDTIVQQNLENSVMVDVTASDAPTPFYQTLLEHNVAIVTANKRANTQSFEKYLLLQNASKKRNVPFHYETNVGAGLPVINVLRNLSTGGDKVIKIEAVLSGTMNYLLSEYNGSQSFSALVLKAKELGITEPDPRDDLSGMDVARKCLILAREIGWKIELNEIEVLPLMNREAIDANDVTSFFIELKKYDTIFETKFHVAKSANKKIRYVAILENYKAKVVPIELDEHHPFYSLKGTENCISLTTNYYQTYPMVIKGPGAGVDVTAAGVLADIIRIAENRNIN